MSRPQPDSAENNTGSGLSLHPGQQLSAKGRLFGRSTTATGHTLLFYLRFVPMKLNELGAVADIEGTVLLITMVGHKSILESSLRWEKR